MMGMLAGHRRYAHITAMRGDAVAAQALGMDKVVSLDALRRALECIDETASTAWIRPALMHAVLMRQTANAQRLVARQFARFDWSRPDSQGCQLLEDQLQLHGWSRRRRVVIVSCARACAAESPVSGGWMDGSSSSIWRAPACTKASGCGSTR